MVLIAQRVLLDDVIAGLQRTRAVFHSEADVQHAFAVEVGRSVADLRVRLEVPFRGAGSTYLDVLVSDPETGESTAVEVKYFTARLDITDPLTQERFSLRSHGADDLLRLHFARDLARLEGWAGPQRSGIALLLTNASGLWSEPRGASPTRDRAFRIHEGRTLGGSLVWGDGDAEENDLQLNGRYTTSWRDYSDLTVPRGVFRWLAVDVPRTTSED
ncbi:hypothetical protein OG218_15995 [Kineococcus sp. NBC_00420]|uniref:hypothetical protein n=1 Tax=Kineococcus sp. NBC_00420 TaxID=2903564 RepID=UPI002E23F529